MEGVQNFKWTCCSFNDLMCSEIFDTFEESREHMMTAHNDDGTGGLFTDLESFSGLEIDVLPPIEGQSVI